MQAQEFFCHEQICGSPSLYHDHHMWQNQVVIYILLHRVTTRIYREIAMTIVITTK